jgi:hypothetical protein
MLVSSWIYATDDHSVVVEEGRDVGNLWYSTDGLVRYMCITLEQCKYHTSFQVARIAW